MWSEDGTDTSAQMAATTLPFRRKSNRRVHAGSMVLDDWALGPAGDRDSRVALIPSLDPTGQSVIEHAAASQPEKRGGGELDMMASLGHHKRPTQS